MKTGDFDYDLPRALIAQRPARPRDAARLLEVGTELADLAMGDLPGLLRGGDVLVLNDTRVIPAQLQGKRGAVKIALTLHKPVGSRPAKNIWRAFARPAKRLRPGDVIEFGTYSRANDFRTSGFQAQVMAKRDGGEVELAFSGMALDQALARFGHMPLPPYIDRRAGFEAADDGDYQTVYAKCDGAVAAPTAGLHFTEALLAGIKARGVAVETVTLHVGGGTFLPVRTERIEDHRMHSEWGHVSRETARAINEAVAAGGRVIACGTTTLRLLESAAAADGTLKAFDGETDIFITPGYRFRIVDLLLTNFHLPKTTLLMLVAAFSGLERIRSAYQHAKRAKYRFYSYGDCTLLHRMDDKRVDRQRMGQS
jgi:S-adenosylmethionine:tRNA ribosyltransferase-isomerase